jgi:3-oxoacyl-[acyl-carrier protein] reductase
VSWKEEDMLTGKVALVTGAGRGIGREIALTLAGYGADVIVNYNGSKEKAEEVVAQIEAMGRKAKAVQCSVADFESCGQMITDMLAEFGHIDILVNNAGITRDNLVIKMTEDDFDAVIDTNLKGTFNTIKHMYRPFLKQKAGRIINLSSVSGVLGNAGQANYSASKAGVIGLTKSLARELASRSITVNAVAPGFIDTDMTQAMTDTAKAATLEQIPLKRVGTPKDIAEAVAFLASDKASYITGQVLSVDGGMAI